MENKQYKDNSFTSKQHSPSPFQSTFLQPLTKTSHVTTTLNSILQRGRRIKLAAEMGLVRSSHGSHWSRALHRKIRRKRKNGEFGKKEDDMVELEISDGFVGDSDDDDDDDSGDEKVDVERKVRALQMLVPGGESLCVESLFEETADYIMALQVQVKAMKVLASFFDGLEKEDRKVGG